MTLSWAWQSAKWARVGRHKGYIMKLYCHYKLESRDLKENTSLGKKEFENCKYFKFW